MLIDAYGKIFAGDSRSEKTVPNDTVLGQTADEIAEMVSCYASDGRVFYKKGDLVNAAASFAYGSGWLDSGRYLGYLAGSPSAPPEIDDCLLESLAEHLTEKTYRYHRMLTNALEGVTPAPDQKTAAMKTSEASAAMTRQMAPPRGPRRPVMTSTPTWPRSSAT